MKRSIRMSCLPLTFCLAATLLVCPVSAGDLAQVARLTAMGGAATDQFGNSVSVDSGVALVGAVYEDSLAGAAYVYRFDGATWVEEQKLVGSNVVPGDRFGISVSVSGDVALIGAYSSDSNAGAAYVFRFDGSAWVEEQRLVPDVVGFFGYSVSVDGDRALVGAVAEGGAGAAHVYRYQDGSWNEEQILTASDGDTGERFGQAVSIKGDFAAVGARHESGTVSRQGATYVYRFDGTTWAHEQKLTPEDRQQGDGFGNALSIDGDCLVIGSSGTDTFTGRTWVYRFAESNWTLEQELISSDPTSGDLFGVGVSLDDNLALVGASGDGTNGTVSVFRFDGSTWSLEQRIEPDTVGSDEMFGIAVSLDGDVALAGAWAADSLQGATYVLFGASCMDGTVNATSGDTANVLYVQGSDGGASRTVEINEGEFVVVTMVRPPAGGSGRFVLHANEGTPTPISSSLLPFDVGTSCFTFLARDGANPAIVANGLGRTGLLGSSQFLGTATEDPESATTSFAYLEPLPVGTTLTFQGLVVDPAADSARGVSVTNAVALVVLP